MRTWYCFLWRCFKKCWMSYMYSKSISSNHNRLVFPWIEDESIAWAVSNWGWSCLADSRKKTHRDKTNKTHFGLLKYIGSTYVQKMFVWLDVIQPYWDILFGCRSWSLNFQLRYVCFILMLWGCVSACRTLLRRIWRTSWKISWRAFLMLNAS